MKKRLIVLALLLISSLFVCCQSGNQTSEYVNNDEVIVESPYWEKTSSSPDDRPVSRTSGVAPLAVHFFADFVDSVDGDERIDRYHHYDYTWDFGDPGSGVWGTGGKSKNMAKGANAVHIYEEAGVYSITLTIRNHSGIVGTEHYTVTVTDADSFYDGKTVYVNQAGDNVFPGAPDSATKIATDDLSTIVSYATPGSRILFKRGSSWTTAGLVWPANSGPVTIGAYGTGENPDAQGIYENAPRITVTGGTFLSQTGKQNWRVMDLHLVDSTGGSANSFGGAVGIRQWLFLRLKVEGFYSGIGWSHWNGADCMQKDDMVIASCNVSGSECNILYVGSERLALIGNILSDAGDSHVVRIWQGYRSVVSHNYISGSSINSTSGRSALKFHGPGYYPGGQGSTSLGEPVANTGLVSTKSEFAVVSDNVFGSSGPWPVNFGPQNGGADERVHNIIFERNKLYPDFGNSSSRLVTITLHIWGRYYSIRNNIFDDAGGDPDDGYYAMVIEQAGVEPAPTQIEIYNNTIYRGEAASNTHRGIVIRPGVTDTIIKNNIIWFPYATGTVQAILDEGSDSVIAGNLLNTPAGFTAPNEEQALDRDFSLQPGSPAIDQGISVPVYEDMDNKPRPVGNYDIGAYENG